MYIALLLICWGFGVLGMQYVTERRASKNSYVLLIAVGKSLTMWINEEQEAKEYKVQTTEPAKLPEKETFNQKLKLKTSISMKQLQLADIVGELEFN
jgi:hypothetical protein